ncbi:hypothetical protein HK099_004118, partial [Clydaea vesicula]
MPSSSTPESTIQVSLQECIWTVVAFRNTTTDFTEATNSLKKNNTRSRLVIPPKIPEELTSKYIFLNFLGLNLKTWETNQEETLYRNKNVLLNIPIPEITFAAGILSLKLCLIKDTLGPKKLIQFDTILKEFDINFGIALMKELILKNNEKKNEDFYMQPILFRIQSFTYFNLKNFGNWLIPMWSFMKLDFNDSFDSVVNVTEQKIEFNPFKSPLAYLSGSVAIGKPISFPVLNNFTLNFDIAYRNTKIFKVELSNLNGELGVIYGSILGESIDESGGKAKINECIFEYTTKGKVVVNIENAHANYVNESEKIWYLDQFLGSINDNILVEAEIDDSTSIRMTSVLVDNLRQYLIDLNDSLTNQTIDSKSLAIDIKSTTELIPLEKSDYVISLLFHKQTGILSFILKSKGLKHQEPAKKILLSFLADLIGENKLNLTNYYVEIKNCCVGIFKHPKEGSATKLASFEPLISIAAISNKTVTQGMDQLFTLYLNEYFAVKTGKLKSSIFILLGTIAKNFPKQIHDLSKEREIFLRYLISSIKSFQDAKDLDLNFISGAIRGLDLWLCSFPELSKENTSHVYQTVIHVINLPEDLNRYDLPKGGIQDRTQYYTSAYLDSFACLVEVMSADELDDGFMSVIEQMMSNMLIHFPKFYITAKFSNAVAMRQLLFVLFKKGSIFTKIWTNIVYEALILTCSDSYQTALEVAAGEDESETIEILEHAYKDYFVLWETLFKINPNENSSEDAEEFLTATYDLFIFAIFQLIKNLDLTTTEAMNGLEEKEEDDTEKNTKVWKAFPLSGNVSNLSAKNPKDFLILLNLVEFAGFETEIVSTATESQKISYSIFVNYLKEVRIKMHYYRDDLLASCLQLLLNAPQELIFVGDLVALKFGLSYTPLAFIALNALEKWPSVFKSGKERKTIKLGEIYGQVLPFLKAYLDVDTHSSFESEDSGGIAKSNAVMRFQSKKVKANDPFINQSETLKLRELQFRILSVLGGVGSEHAACVMNEVPNDHESKVKESKLISWDPVKHLSYNIPFKDANIKIFFDDLLPRIVELSENSPERKSKVAACELLHALTVFMIGKSAHRTKENESSQSPFHKLYIHIFPALFRLAADVDNVTRDLFRPLIFQLIHWLTRNSKYENPETMAMLDACLEAVVSNNGTVRDFAADSACEFLKWSIKQTSIQTQRNNPINAKSLFKRLYLLANHGNSNKRYGSALVFNRIYRVFREEASLVEIFSFEILYNLLTSLKISSNDHSVMGTQQQTQTAIRHWKKIIVNKASLFKAVNEKRRLFPGIATADLSHLIEYLFIESGTPIGVYARECLSLFIEMVRHVADPAQWVRDKLKTPALLPGIFEKSKLNIGKSNTLENQDTKASLFQLIAAFDGYNTLLELNIVPAESLFKNKSSEFLFSVFSMLNLVNNFKVSNLLLSSQSKSLKELIASLVTKCLSFITIILKSSTTNSFQNLEYISTILHSPQFFSIVCKTIFHPGQIGFVVEDDEVKRHLPLITGNFLKNFLKLSKHPDCQVKKIYDDFINYLSLNFKEVYSNVESPHELSNSKNLLQIYNGVKLLQSVGGEDFVGLLGMHDALISCLSLLDKYRYNSTDPNNQSLIAVMTDICLSNKVIRICYLDQFLGIGDDSDVAFELSSLNYQKFSVYINPHLALHWNEFTAIFKKDAKKKILVEILQGLLDYLIRNKSVAKMEAIKFMGDFTAGVEFLSLFLDSRIETSKGNESLLNIWKSLAKLDPNILTHSNNEDFIKLFTETFFKFLDRLLPLQFKVSALDLLPSVLRKTCVDFQVKLNKYLKILIVDTFPISPSDLKIGTSRYNDYSITMEKLLNIIQLTGSTDVIEIVLEHTLREADHIYSVELSNRISIAVDTLSATEMSKPMVRRIIDLGFNCDVSMLSDVTVDEINYIVGKIVELPARKVEELVDQLVIKTICFEVMEIVYSRLSIQEVHSKNGRIVTSYNSNDEKNDSTLTKILMRAAHDAKREMVPVGESEQLGKIRLAYHQAAYAALAAVVSKTQTEEKFFTVFLFSESISKGTYLWDNIIDKNKKIFFEDLTKPLVQTSLDDFRRKSKTSLTSTTYGQNLKYLSSQYLQDSSLSQTVGFLSNRSLSQNTDVNFQAATISAGMEIGSNSKGERKPQESSRILEIDEINSNICMKGIISCIEKLHTTVSPPINKIPKWIAPLQEKFNKDEAFSAVASDWWRSLIKLISEASNFGSGINHFVQSYLVANSVHKSKYAINNNQKIIRSFIELWKEFIVPPTESIYGFISSNDIFENRLYTQTKITGLYLCSIFAMNEISPFHEASCSVSAVQFYSALIATLDLKKTEIVSLSSTVIGQLLSLCEINRDMISMNILLNLTHAKVYDFGHPNLIFISNASKALCLEAMTSAAKDIPDLIAELRAKDLIGLLTHRDDACQTYTLNLLTQLTESMTLSDIEFFLDQILSTFYVHPSEPCRRAFYSLIIKLFKIPNVLSSSVTQLLKRATLIGLADSDEQIRNGILSFLHKDLLRPNVFDRAKQLMSVMIFEDSKEAPSYTSSLFDESLPNAHFDRPLRINVSYIQNSAMQPMFASTQTEDMNEKIGDENLVLRATQNDQWTPTVPLTSTQTRNMFSFSQSDTAILSVPKITSHDNSGNAQKPRISVYELKHRTYNKEAPSYLYYAKRAETRRRNKAKTENLKMEAQAKKVSLTRVYRSGELPDIQILNKEIISPLQVLARVDVEVSRQVYYLILQSLLKEKAESQRRFPNGCRESILEKVNFEPALKKPRTSATKKGLYSEIWSKIAMLYKKMENSEVYHAIYESKIACAQQTKDAIRFESVGNYEKALETFIEALRSENREETQMDLDLWTTGQLECLRKLGKWDELSAISIDEVDGNLSKLWDEDIVDPYLAYFIQSHVRLKNGRIEEQIFYPWTEEEPNPLHTFIDKYLSPNENEKRYPNVEKDSLEVWDDIIFNRKTMLETVPEMAFNFESYEKKFCRKIAKAAREQISLSVAGNWLEKYKPSNNDLYPDYHYPLLKNFLKRLHHSSNLSESINNAGDVLGTFNYYKSSIEKLSEPVQRKFLLLEGCLHSKISEILLDETNKNDILAHIQKNRYFVKDTKNLSSEFCSLGDYQLSFINRAFTSFDFITKNVAESTEYKILEKTFFSFNQFCDKILRKMENYHYDISGNLDKELFATTVVTTNLNLMSKFRNSESVNFFPRLLQIVEIYPATIAPFIKMAESVPLWLFLKWVAQLTAMLDKKSSNGVFPILLKIAKRYPAALIFPLYISSNQYVYQNDQESWKIQDSVKILKELVKSDLLFKLLSELKRLGEPAHIFKDWLDTLPLLLMGQAKAKISESFDEMKTYCLHEHHECMGSVGKSFSQKHGSKILSICGLNGENISKKNYNELIKYYAEKISVEKLNSGTILLKEYSPWLDSFKSANFDELLEVPGQYEGIEKPNILHHTKIFSFHPTVLVMNSIRKPKKITLIGTDEKEYSWLIKGGEDLRLDQRIQQMFQIMNNILSNNHYCSKNQISLKTYKVVPLTGNLGMIEWYELIISRDCLKSEIGFEKATEAARSLFLENLTKNHKKGGFGEIYASFNTKEKKESVVASFKKVLSVMSEPFLKRYFLKKSSSPEAFLKIRSEFASSLGSLSICSYLLGIGDRHTENFLLDELSGKIIAIDFGHAFGSATEVLPIPEMIPFRLTNQMELFLKPLGKSVLLRQPMISSLQALREKKDLVLNVMDIFIKEPLIEWRDRAMKSAKKQKSAKTASMEGKEVANANEDNGSIAPTWYPIKKLEIASRKLKGENPAVIMIEELSLGHNQKPYFAPLSEAIRGDKQVNFRAQASCTNLAIPDQVDCLIDLATDANILGRTWLGWNPW